MVCLGNKLRSRELEMGEIRKHGGAIPKFLRSCKIINLISLGELNRKGFSYRGELES